MQFPDHLKTIGPMGHNYIVSIIASLKIMNHIFAIDKTTKNFRSSWLF